MAHTPTRFDIAQALETSNTKSDDARQTALDKLDENATYEFWKRAAFLTGSGGSGIYIIWFLLQSDLLSAGVGLVCFIMSVVYNWTITRYNPWLKTVTALLVTFSMGNFHCESPGHSVHAFRAMMNPLNV